MVSPNAMAARTGARMSSAGSSIFSGVLVMGRIMLLRWRIVSRGAGGHLVLFRPKLGCSLLAGGRSRLFQGRCGC